MKLILTLLFLLFLAPVVFAQVDSNKALSLAPPKFVEVNNKVDVKKQTTVRLCSPCSAVMIAPALVVIFSHDKIIYKSATSGPNIFDKIPPYSIKSVNIFKDSLSVVKYGVSSKNGVIEIYIDDKNYPMSIKYLKLTRQKNKKTKPLFKNEALFF
jgi:hypothetical protein